MLITVEGDLLRGCSWRFGLFSIFRFSGVIILLIMDIERVVQCKLPKHPFVWCTNVYSIYVSLLTCSPQVPWLIFLSYPYIEWILCAFPGCNLPGFQITTGPTTVDWRKGWGKDPATIFGIYNFIFSSSSKGCWHSPLSFLDPLQEWLIYFQHTLVFLLNCRERTWTLTRSLQNHWLQ